MSFVYPYLILPQDFLISPCSSFAAANNMVSQVQQGHDHGSRPSIDVGYFSQADQHLTVRFGAPRNGLVSASLVSHVGQHTNAVYV